VTTDDADDLARFVRAQAGMFDQAIMELRAGRKRSHWMWFVFPQLKGLGHSLIAEHYGLASLEEARAYLRHPLLGHRLQAAVLAVQASPAANLRDLFGAPDDLKFRSSMTLFAIAAPASMYAAALERWCGGERDPRTLDLLRVPAEAH
jgi:uncharacterized protein (DUF1810 family)